MCKAISCVFSPQCKALSHVVVVLVLVFVHVLSGVIMSMSAVTVVVALSPEAEGLVRIP